MNAILAASLAAILSAPSGRVRELTVSPEGLSPAAALSEIRRAHATDDSVSFVVHVKKGVYRLSSPLVMNRKIDSCVTWEGEDGAVFSGGEKLGPWTERDGILVAKVPAGRWFEQLFVNGRRAVRARYPNTGWLAVSKPVQTPLAKGRAIDYVSFTNVADRAALASLSRDEFSGAQLLVVHKWAMARYVFGDYVPGTGTLTVSGYVWPDWKVWNEHDTLCAFENVRFGFDAPGEWFLDAKAGEVLYRPLPGETATTLEALAPMDGLSQLLRVQGEAGWNNPITNVVFRNLAFEHTSSTPTVGSPTGRGPTECDMHQAATTCDGAVELAYVRNVRFENCRFAHTGNHGMRWRDACRDNAIVSCVFDDCGAGGIWMGTDKPYVAAGETLSRREITTLAKESTAFNVISNCLITGGGRFNMEGVGICLTHCSDTKVVHNEIRDNYYSGISVGWTWGYGGSVAQRNEIAYNLIYDLGKGIMSDMGGVYMLGTAFGTRVHHNVIHDVTCWSYGAWGLYTDQGSENVVFENNLTWNTTDGAMHQHYGVGCIVRNNIFAQNRDTGVFRTWRQKAEDVPSTIHFVGNICYTETGPLLSEDSDAVLGLRDGNLFWRPDGKGEFDRKSFETWQASGRGRGNVYADPLFVDAANHDYRLKKNSPAFALGFKEFDYTQAGRTSK